MNNQKNNLFIGLASILLVFGSLWVVWKMTSSSSSLTKVEVAKNIQITPNDTIKGDVNAPITLVEYSDFQCPSCKVYSPTVKSVVEANADVRMVYRHFPLDQHENARLAAAAAESAGKQKKFFEYHDILFENQDQWATLKSKEAEALFITYAEELKLNVDTFKQDIISNAVKDAVEADYQSGIQYGVDSTPSFYIDGVRVKPQSLADFQALIDNARKKRKSDSPKTSTSSGDISITPAAEDK